MGYGCGVYVMFVSYIYINQLFFCGFYDVFFFYYVWDGLQMECVVVFGENWDYYVFYN